ncbi:hypothetical protein N5C16_05575 [Stenotrophomonas sp. GD03908]|uniref:Uncharacterized protein n=1 Tax=Stenotrophomonas maltophilia TaxID=40324 RepID=A0AAJ2TKN9_STEMA|nr:MULTISPECIES: hypothetical protein [Stenotrophomonas]MBH1480802.1 hypothetical protein [Stenotrophomonas maltophilia]MCU1061915.1 hypothetical protein [Stenotrophomonas maltophilia]MDH0978723.1 hypothetical protein [Stenotrophomonas sp. GD03908]MDQ7295409.1 hypothetical protein [Stenotrophomonas sp. Sm0041]MDZ5764838.1 hypothetical protein [Stenotrophomonas maltophilia]
MESARNRAWRRSQARNRGGDRATTAYSYKPEKNWKLLYTRDAKLARARQLGFTYPVLGARQLQEQE